MIQKSTENQESNSRKAKKKTIEDQINHFLEVWNCEAQLAFFRDIHALWELYDVDEEDDWVQKKVGSDDVQNIRLIRTVYLMSRIADFHAGRLVTLKSCFRDLWKKLEKQVSEDRDA